MTISSHFTVWILRISRTLNYWWLISISRFQSLISCSIIPCISALCFFIRFIQVFIKRKYRTFWNTRYPFSGAVCIKALLSLSIISSSTNPCPSDARLGDSTSFSNPKSHSSLPLEHLQASSAAATCTKQGIDSLLLLRAHQDTVCSHAVGHSCGLMFL